MNWQDWEEFRDGQWVPVMRIILKVGLVIGIGVAIFLQFQGREELSTESDHPSDTHTSADTNQPVADTKAP